MKRTLLFLIILTSGKLFAADWDLFPYRQRSYFSDNYIVGKSIVDVFAMDSVKVNGPESVLYFKKNLDDQLPQSCPVITYPMGAPPELLYNENYFDSLIVRGDTVFFSSQWSTTPFYFLPNASVGQSWTTNSTYGGNGYSQITITCSSIGLDTLFDITDSLKTFTMTSNGTSSNQTPISHFQMRLSKSHGLLEFVPFQLFHYHPAYYQFKTLKLIGWELNGNKGGYVQPKFEDYFHLSAGDILQWQYDADPVNIMLPNTTDYFRDSITQVIDSPDSLVYICDETVLYHDSTGGTIPGVQIVYSKSSVGGLIHSLPMTFAFGTIPYSSSYNPDVNSYWNSSYITISLDSISNDSVSEYRFEGLGYYVDPLNCEMSEVIDLSENITLSTTYGVKEYCFGGFGTYCHYIIGSRINGVTTGNITIGVDELHAANNSSPVFYPNPANDKLFIRSNMLLPEGHFEIYNLLGKKVKAGNLEGDQIAIDELSSGLYLIRMFQGSDIIISHFVKQ